MVLSEAALYLAGCDFAMGNLQEAREKLNHALVAISNPDTLEEHPFRLILEAQMEYNLGVMRAKKGFDYHIAHKHIVASLRKMETALSKEEERKEDKQQSRTENYEVLPVCSLENLNKGADF